MALGKVALIVAMEAERSAMAEAVGDALERFVVVVSGIGKVRAALATADVIRAASPRAVLSVGVSGALSPDVGVGDLVVGCAVVQHDVDAQALGAPPGAFPDGDTRRPADPRLVAELEAAVRASLPGRRHHRGVLAAGDRFVHDAALRARLHAAFGALAVDMESAAVGFTATQMGVPFAVLRAVSDRADGSAAGDFAAFLGEAARDLGRVLKAFAAGADAGGSVV